MIEKTIKGIKYLLDEENLTAEVIQKKGYEGDFIIPETVVFKKVAYRVTSIGEWAFYKCSSLTSMVIPDSDEDWRVGFRGLLLPYLHCYPRWCDEYWRLCF